MGWRVENISFGWGAKRWAVRRYDDSGVVVERLIRDGKERTFLREHRANSEAGKLANTKPDNAEGKPTPD